VAPGLSVGNDNQITDCLIQGNQSGGIVVGNDNQITDCLIQGNRASGSRWCQSQAPSIHRHGHRRRPRSSDEQRTWRATISDCTIAANAGPGITSVRDSFDPGCNITRNAPYGIQSPDGGNTIVDCTISFNGPWILGKHNGPSATAPSTTTSMAFFSSEGVTISDSTVSYNTLGGIFVFRSSYVLNNVVNDNGSSTGINPVRE
jgi:parallel beta-helix repeat protein